MEEHVFSTKQLIKYRAELVEQERAKATVDKYMHDVGVFTKWLAKCGTAKVTKSTVIEYKAELVRRYAATSVNSMLAALNGFLSFMGWYECRVKNLKIQADAYTNSDRELTREEYIRLVRAAKESGDERLCNVLQTICGTGIRVSELPFITVDAVTRGFAMVNNKGKTRKVLLTRRLCGILKGYCKAKRIRHGSVFVARSGRAIKWH